MKTTISNKKTVLLLFGGESQEHDVSIASARNIYAALDLERITPILCYITREGRWLYTETMDEYQDAEQPVAPLLGTSAVVVGDKKMSIDILFPVLHGTHGEDGTVQGLAALLHTPIVGCGVTGSVLCIDKVLTKQLLEIQDIPIVPYSVYQAGDKLPNFRDMTDQLGTTLFVKPACQGSSVGVSKVRTSEEFAAAIKTALQHDSTILIESAVDGARELEVAMLGSAASPRVSVVGEVIPDRDFYNYESKYDTASTSQITIPAVIDADVAAYVQKLARRAFTVLHCTGLARIDFLLGNDGSVYLNEVNTLPGFTDISMYPRLFEAVGMPYKELVRTLIDQAA